MGGIGDGGTEGMTTNDLLESVYALDILSGLGRESDARFMRVLQCAVCGKPAILGCFVCKVIRCLTDVCPHMAKVAELRE